jgi:Rad3-related DNA helicase
MTGRSAAIKKRRRNKKNNKKIPIKTPQNRERKQIARDVIPLLPVLKLLGLRAIAMGKGRKALHASFELQLLGPQQRYGHIGA